MSTLDTLPGWAAVLVAVLVLGGALLACIGSVGLVWLKSFYSRMHAPTLGTTLGLFLMVAATMLFFWLTRGILAWHALLIGVFVTATTPITMMLLARAALERDRTEGATHVPPALSDETD